MLKCPCGFKTTNNKLFREHVRTCHSAKNRMAQHRTEADDNDMFDLFDIGISETEIEDTPDDDKDDDTLISSGAGASDD